VPIDSIRSATASASVVAVAAAAIALAAATPALAGPPPAPAYDIVELGVIDPADFGVQGQGMSPGGVAVGRTLGTTNQAFLWTAGGGLVPLPKLPSRVYAGATDANDTGAVVGTAADTFFGTNPLPVVWIDGVVSVLPLPSGQNIGRANGINDAGLAVGSVNGGSLERAAIYDAAPGGSASVITTAAKNGSTMTTAFGINAAGLVAGIGTDPANAARNVGMVYDTATDTMLDIGALPGRNGAIAFAIGDGGHVVGTSMLNQGSGVPFIWTAEDGMQAVPLPAGTSQGSARGVNASGMVVGIASNAFAIPFLSDGTTTWSLAELIPDGTGWDLDMNTSSGALGISDDGVIVGTGEFNGQVRAFAMIPVTADCPADLDGDGNVGFGDLLAVLNAWGACTGCDEDLDGDGIVGFSDVTTILAAWGPCV
jgi:uncharacterized membrane protein